MEFWVTSIHSLFSTGADLVLGSRMRFSISTAGEAATDPARNSSSSSKRLGLSASNLQPRPEGYASA